MAIKTYPTSSTGLSANELGGGTSHSGTFPDVASGTGDLRTRIWSELVTRDAREKNVFAKFIGGEGSGKPIIEKTNLSAGGSDKVTFTTVAPIRGQGVRGEDILKNSTGSLSFGTFNVEVDLIRHAVSWTQVLKLMRFTGKTLDQLSAEVMSEWAARTEQDHLQMVLRDTCLNPANTDNVLQAYGSGPSGALYYSDGLSTDIIQEVKQRLISRGGQAMNTGGDDKQEIPGYLFFAPDDALRPLRSDPDYLEAITQADARGADNKLYSGSYAKWDNNIIANHNIIVDTADGRQGSPLAPIHILDNAVTNAATAFPTTAFVSDENANFLGAEVNLPGGGGAAHETFDASTTTAYLLFVDGTTGELGLYSYNTNPTVGTTGWGALTAVDPVGDGTVTTLTGGVGTNGVFKTAAAHASTSDAWAAGTKVYQCNAVGTPVSYALAMGQNALYYAKGAVTNEQIFHYDDFANSGNDAHLSAIGVQSVYGMAVYQDTKGRIPGVQLVECVRQIPGLAMTQTT
tara:strand:+ start:2353 stop:3897 length:1545 start_codon:yes stop_codon:yes gene_type:complete